MLHTVYVALAAFFAWQTLRYAATEYAYQAFAATRVLHPLVVAALPLAVLWPDWIRALAVAGIVGFLVAGVERLSGAAEPVQQYVPQRTARRTLPSLP